MFGAVVFEACCSVLEKMLLLSDADDAFLDDVSRVCDTLVTPLGQSLCC